MIDFKNISYLKVGNPRQRVAYQILQEIAIFDILQTYKPILTGTIPIEIDIPESDLDIICQCHDHEKLSSLLKSSYGNKVGFEITVKSKPITTTICRFQHQSFIIEIFAQNKPPEEQNAYIHMINEYQILKEKGDTFKSHIIQLKKKGIKTEPAFALLLHLKGDAYEQMLNY